MNPVLVEIYSTIVPSMPFIIGAYVLMWLAILVYMLVITLSYKKAEKQMAVLEEAGIAGKVAGWRRVFPSCYNNRTPWTRRRFCGASRTLQRKVCP